jgi:hypothetical protein
MRHMAYSAALFDSTPDAAHLKHLSDAIEEVDAQATRLLAMLDGLYVEVKEFQGQVDRLIADEVTEHDDYKVFAYDDTMMDRLAALYKLDHRPGGYRSQNGITT